MVEASICSCGQLTTPPRRSCLKCGRIMKAIELENKGKILTYTTLHAVPEGFQAPLDIVMVELDKGAKLLCRYRGDPKPEMGMDVNLKKERDQYYCEPIKGEND